MEVCKGDCDRLEYASVVTYKTEYKIVNGRTQIWEAPQIALVPYRTQACWTCLMQEAIRHANPPPSANPAPKE